MTLRNKLLDKIRILQWNDQGVQSKQTYYVIMQYPLHVFRKHMEWRLLNGISPGNSPHISGAGDREVSFVRYKSAPYMRININVTLEEGAVSFDLNKFYTIYSFYIIPECKH